MSFLGQFSISADGVFRQVNPPALVKTEKDFATIPTVVMHNGAVTCPYCEREHFHGPSGGQRTANCFGGEYIVVVAKPEPSGEIPKSEQE